MNIWLTQTADSKQHPLPSSSYLQKNAEFALKARSEVPVASKVPQDLFQRFVVPYRQLDEPIDDWRSSFFEVLSPFAKDKSITTVRQAVEAVVPRIWTELRKSSAVLSSPNSTAMSFKENCTPQIMAPISETLAAGHASCSGCSILAANGLRAVGIPARVVGTPDWSTGGNHNWVEVWTGEGEDPHGWQFFDAVPGEAVTLDHAWFVPANTKEAVSPEHGIFASVWDAASADVQYPYTWRDPVTHWPAKDRTAYYRGLSPQL